MPREGWKTVSLQEGLVKEIEKVLEENPSYWRSRSDLVTYAVRRFLESIREEVAKKKVQEG